ncbi:hypothetical protein UA08_02141 [Talaromyces atroroseus]|uniref:C2H2-type domain-containing protein n=1 Tax=Talaromyces atroroseus TaxID=1441469 RepID=A0A225AKP0_TALAT|nr:hypothetical protein UA08_02141 [Talaromyces atroroseus]OKL62102.1 hypothetical protein UA08_02141 [Talaromyces atroroseus]
MPRAEAGSTKAISNKIKQRGLTRLKWYCQPCEKACRDANGFKCHVQSESHVRQMLLIGENSKATIDQYSAEFLREFISLLKTTHQEKKVNINHFYQQVISKKDHIHMNATKWSSLTEFCKYLGREGICRVEETEKGLFISWIDNSPETLRRKEAVMKKERQDKGDEEREQKQIQAQIERMRKAELAKAAAAAEKSGSEEDKERAAEKSNLLLERKEGDKVKLSFGAPKAAATTTTTTTTMTASGQTEEKAEEPKSASASKPAISFSSSSASTTSKPKNVFSSSFAPKTNNTVKNPLANPLAGTKKSTFVPQQQKVSQQEMIMKREMEAMERKNNNNKRMPSTNNVFDSAKRQRTDKKPLLIIIDALDECAGEANIALIVDLLAQIPQDCGKRLLVFMTSRPDYCIRPELFKVEHKEFKLQFIIKNVTNGDIILYITNYITKEFKSMSIKVQAGREWPGKNAIDSLVDGAASLFTWAALLIR